MKTIRIFHLIPVADGVQSWGKLTRELQEPLASPDVEITLADLPDAPVKLIMSGYHTELVAPLCVQAAIKAEQEEYDAVVIDCLDEPGLTATKEALSIPVVGDTEAVLHYASLVGRRFSFLLPGYTTGRMLGADTSGYLEDLVRKYGFASKLASMRSVPANSLEFAGQEQGLPKAMLEQARKAVDEDGADAIISYGGIDVVSYMREHLDVPVIDSVQSSTMMAESLVRLKLTQSKRAYPRPHDLEQIQSLIG
jgi:allantoin racemase